jgi:hypothetical protein
MEKNPAGQTAFLIGPFRPDDTRIDQGDPAEFLPARVQSEDDQMIVGQFRTSRLGQGTSDDPASFRPETLASGADRTHEDVVPPGLDPLDPQDELPQ